MATPGLGVTRVLIKALSFGYAAFAGTFLVVNAPLVMLRSGLSFGGALNLVSVALGLGLLCSAGVLVFQAPVLGGLRVALGSRLTRIQAAFVGAALMPGPFVVYLAALRDPNEDPNNMRGWLELWSRLPGEFVLGCAPFLLACVVFAVTFVPEKSNLRPA